MTSSGFQLLGHLRKGLSGWVRRFSTRPRFLALAAFLFAGDLKADPNLAWVPVDLTLATGTVLVGVLGLRLARGARLASGRVLALLAVWFLTFLPGVWGMVPSGYGIQKVGTIFTFTLLAALAPLVLVERDEDLLPLVNAMALFCLGITLGGLLGTGPAGLARERLQAFGAGTISLGRATGLLFLHGAVVSGAGGPMPLLTLGIMALAAVTSLFAGSRGPILAALIALGALLVVGRRRETQGEAPGRGLLNVLRLAVEGLLLAGVLGASLSMAPSGSLFRLESFFQGRYGESEHYRVSALQHSWKVLREAPAGLGWGRFSTEIDPEKGLDRQYPHNLLAEVTLEGGWICGATTLLVLGLALAAGWSRSFLLGGRLAFAGVLFYSVNALVSGDLNDNRPLFMFVSSSLVLLEVRP